jgi:hypothetical protein
MAQTKRKTQRRTSKVPRPTGGVPASPARLVRLPVRTAHPREIADGYADRCLKCSSTFVVREPAFLHCRYCGTMTRIQTGSLLEQELFELRSGLRLAS